MLRISLKIFIIAIINHSVCYLECFLVLFNSATYSAELVLYKCNFFVDLLHYVLSRNILPVSKEKGILYRASVCLCCFFGFGACVVAANRGLLC